MRHLWEVMWMVKSRGGILKLNFITSFVQELIIVIFGLIFPRIILLFFGSTYNGLLNSVANFLAFSVVLRAGLGNVTNVALYKPLAEGNLDKISSIMVATNKFMIKVGYLLAAIILGFAFIYPFLVLDEFGYWFSFSLILIVGAASWIENMFSIKYKILLQADQKYYIITIVTIVAYVLSNIFGIILTISGFGIHIVRIGMLMGLMTTPFILKLYVERHYEINWTAKPDDEAIKSRWNALAQQLASIANNNVSTILITIILPLKELSVYTVYYMVVKNVNQLLSTSFVGIRSTFGNMYAQGEFELLKKRFKDFEWLVFAGGAILYSVTAILLTPFVSVYTSGISDVNYNRYWLGLLIVLSSYLYITRIPYQMLVEALGLFRETRNSAIMEIVLNIVVSIITFTFLGLNGIVMGALIGGIVRTVNLIFVCNKKILNISLLLILKKYIIYLGLSCSLILLSSNLIEIRCVNFVELIVIAIPVMIVTSVIILIASVIFNRMQLVSFMKYMRKKR